MRLFIAIPLPEDIKQKALEMQGLLDKKLFRLAKVEQIHLTIAFLGEMPEAESIVRKLERIRFQKFSLKTKGYGFFPSINKIRVVWIGLEENNEFIKLQHDIRNVFNFKEKLMPHITIARARTIIIDKENHWNKILSKIGNDDQEFIVDRFILFESVAESEGHVHKILREFIER